MPEIDTFTGTDASNLELAELAPKLVGHPLKNHATVIACELRRSYFIVLCVTGTGPRAEFVTWALSPRDGECFWGHYYSDLREALEDFQNRAVNNNDTV